MLATVLFVALLIDDQRGLTGRIIIFLAGMYLIYLLLEVGTLVTAVEEKHGIQHPLIGKEVEVIEEFLAVGGGFEGRVTVNGASWSARSKEHQFEVGDKAIVGSLVGQTLQLRSEI